MSAVDAWAVADPTLCPVCGRDACEDHLPADRAAASAEARAAHRVLATAQEVERERARRDARRVLDAEERGPLVAPDLRPLTAWLEEPDPIIPWRIAGWQATESRVILAAPRKAGKTTLVGSLVRSLVDGDLWLGAAVVTPVAGPVAILDTEMSRSQLKRWLREQGIVHTDRVVLAPLRGRASLLNFIEPDCRAAWCTWLDGVQYLIVDCLRPILDALGLDESREAGRWLAGLDALLREAQIPEACLVHHMGHNGERSRGDSRLRDWPDAEWRVLRQDEADGSPRYICAYGRDVDVPESQLAYDRTTRRLTIGGGSRQQVRTENALQAAEAVLRATPKLTGRGVKDALADSDHPRDAIDAALRVGVRAGRLVVEDGPRRSRLYRVSECPGVSGTHSGHSTPDRVSECPAALYKADTPDTPPLPLHGDDPLRTTPDTRRRRYASGARNTRRTRRLAAEKP